MSRTNQNNLPPGPDDEDAYIFIDHREDESSIVEYVSEVVESADALEVREDEDGFFVIHQNNTYKIPLQYSMHDRYIALSSLAEILRDNYNFYLLKSRLDSDTHAVLVVTKSAANCWAKVPDHLQPLELGYDYFGGICVPYLNHEESAPNFSEDRVHVKSLHDFSRDFINVILSGKVTDESAERIAKIVLKDEEKSGKLSGKTMEELTEEVKAELSEALSDTDVKNARAEIEKALSDLRSLSRPKKWWEFWK